MWVIKSKQLIYVGTEENFIYNEFEKEKKKWGFLFSATIIILISVQITENSDDIKDL